MELKKGTGESIWIVETGVHNMTSVGGIQLR